MRHSLSLAGSGWTLSSLSDVGHPPVHVAAMVPNDICDDLERAGVLPDLWYGLNSMNRSEWVFRRSWRLSRVFATPSNARHAWLAFDGVDYNTTISLNGIAVCSHVGAFEPFECSVSDAVRPEGENNTLVVTLHPPPGELIDQLYSQPDGYPKTGEGFDQCTANRLLLRWRSHMAFWDFATKHWSQGVWRHVALHFTGGPPARLHQQLTLAASLSGPHYNTAQLNATVRWRWLALPSLADGRELWLRLDVDCRTDGDAPLARAMRPLRPAGTAWQLAQLQVDVALPRLWWPNGYGSQHLYNVSATLLECAQGMKGMSRCVALDVASEPSFGFRELQVLPNSAPKDWLYAQWGSGPGAPWILNSSDYPRGDRRYYDPRRWVLSVNGRRVFARGGNWVPLDQMYGRAVRDASRLRAVLTMARDAGFVFLRVWSGGQLEDQSFYRLCDELGILLEQEMPVAGCGYGADADGPTIDSWSEQVPMVVRQLQNHPSLARYSQANELYSNVTSDPVAAAYHAAATATDPSRWAREADPNCVGQRHGPYQFAAIGGRGSRTGGYEVFGKGCGNFPQAGCSVAVEPMGGPGDPFEWTEFGMSALSEEATLRSIMPGSSLSPTGASPEWGWHKADGNPFISWQVKQFYSEVFLDNATAASFGSLGEEVRASQWLQAEGYRFAYQAARRRKWHRSAQLAWTLNEPWPNAAHGCMLDYRGLPKHAYWWVKQSMSMVDVSLEYYSLLAVADGSTPLSMPIWIDSELDAPLSACCVALELFWPNGSLAAPLERLRLHGGAVPPSQPTRVAVHSFLPSASAVGDVLLVRVSLLEAAHPQRDRQHRRESEQLRARNTYAFGLVPPGTTEANAVAPLAALLSAPPAALLLHAAPTVNGSTSVITVKVSDSAAHYVKLSLQSAAGEPLAFVSFTTNMETLLPNESLTVTATILRQEELAPCFLALVPRCRACAEAWNAPRVCVPLVEQRRADA